jgi:hypothetical protein
MPPVAAGRRASFPTESLSATSNVNADAACDAVVSHKMKQALRGDQLARVGAARARPGRPAEPEPTLRLECHRVRCETNAIMECEWLATGC